MALSLQQKIIAAGYGSIGGCVLQEDTGYETALDGSTATETLTLRYAAHAPWDTGTPLPVAGDIWPLGNIAGSNNLTDWVVQSSRIIQDGSPAIVTDVTVTLRHKVITLAFVPDPAPVDEVQWQRSDVPLTLHPHFSGYDQSLFAKWLDATGEAKDALEGQASGVTAELIGYHNRGVTHYAFYNPVATRTTSSSGAVASGGAGMRQAPPHSSSLAAAWLKTGSRSTRSGQSSTWQLTEEWTGAAAWDATLYP